MLRSTRAALAVGLGCLGVAGLVGQSVAQQQDSKVTAAKGNTGGQAPAAMPAVSIGSLDVEGVFRAYDKVRVAGETLESEVKIRYAELTKLANEGKQAQDEMEKMSPSSPDVKKYQNKMVQIKAQMEASRENAKREFEQKETETMVGIYNEVADMAKAIANRRNMTFIVKYNEGKLQGSEPNSAMASMSKTIIYADPRVDITADTILYLNRNYKSAGGQPPRTPNPAAAAGTRPSANPAAAPAGR